MMKYLPQSLMITIVGILLTVRGIATGTLWLNIVGDVIAVIGLIWFNCCWDKLIQYIKYIKRQEREVKNIKTQQNDTALIARAADRKASEAKKSADKAHGQYVKGFVKQGERAINFEKELHYD